MTGNAVEVELQASKTCYLSNDPPFYFLIHIRGYNGGNQVTFLQDGYVGVQGYQPINSDQAIQCFDNETGEQVQVIRQGTLPYLLDRSYIQFTTAENRKPYEIPFIISALQPDKKYRLRFKPASPISHWPTRAKLKPDSVEEALSSSVSEHHTPPESNIPWEVLDGNDTILFETRGSAPKTPKVTVSMTVPITHSISKPLPFTLKFTTDVAHPITVLAERAYVARTYTDVTILDATSREELAHDFIICRDKDEHDRADFLVIDGAFTEYRKIDFKHPIWDELELEAGKEYILRHSGGSWWWTEDTVDEVMTDLVSQSQLGLARTEWIEFGSAGEAKFKVVE